MVAGALLWMSLGAVVGGAALWESPLHTVTLSGATALSVEDVVAMTGLSPEVKLSAIDPYALGRQIASHPMVAKADVRRVFPGELIITVQQRLPRYRAQDTNGVEVLLDETLMVLEKQSGKQANPNPAERPALPLVTGIGKSGETNNVLEDPALHRGLAALRRMKAMGFEDYGQIVVDAGHPFLLQVRLIGGQQLIVPEDRMASALAAYWRLRTDTPTLISGPKVIDLTTLRADGGGRVFLRNP